MLYKHIIQVENKNVGLKVGGHKHTMAPPYQKSGGAHAPLAPPLPTPVPSAAKWEQWIEHTCSVCAPVGQYRTAVLRFRYNPDCVCAIFNVSSSENPF